jgi:hypothetical protein
MKTSIRQAYLDLFRPTDAHRELGGRLLAVATVSIVLDFVVAIVVRSTHAASDFRHAFVWTTSELLTGGAGVSIDGFWPHYLELLLQLWAVTAIGALAGSFGAFFNRLHLERTRSVLAVPDRPPKGEG